MVERFVVADTKYRAVAHHWKDRGRIKNTATVLHQVAFLIFFQRYPASIRQ